tara:strand:- start:243 stop:860 length:618 start_codon:yes stop_codon:yes gene_type:complete
MASNDKSGKPGPTRMDPFDKRRSIPMQIRALRAATSVGLSGNTSKRARNSRVIKPGEIMNDGVPDPALKKKEVWLTPHAHLSGQLLEFHYEGQDSLGRPIHDPKPLIIYINVGHKLVCQGNWRYTRNAGDQFITGINIHYTDIEVGAALGRIIKSKGKHINMKEIKRIDKYLPDAAFRMYYLKGIKNAKGMRKRVTKLDLSRTDY